MRAPNDLPVALTSFVGRERELAALRARSATTRLLTVTAPAGAARRGSRCRPRGRWRSFPDGVWWVELAPLPEEALVGAAVAEALGVRPLPGMTDCRRRARTWRRDARWSCSTTASTCSDACAEVVAAVLQAAPEVDGAGHEPSHAGRRAARRIGACRRCRCPAAGRGDAVRRARAQGASGVRADRADAPVVAAVCVRLDGLPLAIELAAARVRTLSVEQLADAAVDRFALLTGGPRTARERQRTLRASVDWSHDLLAADEQRLLRRVAVFAGGFTLEAAERGRADGDASTCSTRWWTSRW